MDAVVLRAVAAASIAVCLIAAAGCAPTIRSGLDDAQLTMRVKTALLNDPDLGVQPITVDVASGVVHLSGRVETADQIGEAERLVRSVDGVRDVRSTLEVGTPEFVGRDRLGRLPSIPGPDTDGPARIIALGAGGGLGITPDGRLGNGVGYGPIIRLRPRNGWGPTIGFSWTRTKLETSPAGQPGLADIAVRPVMGGIEYGISRGRLATGVSVVGGYAINSLRVDTTRVGPGRAIGVDNSLAARAGGNVWYDITQRVGLNLFVGYRVTRPRVTFASDTDTITRRVNADAVLVSVGAAYWLF